MKIKGRAINSLPFKSLGYEKLYNYSNACHGISVF